jgi:DNA invertase Pin-like site-specific DNA recombinase
MNSDKIRSEHLSRRAFVYVRQSSLGQVRQHRESGQRQYDLEHHARTLGWADVVVVDEDQGKSGATAAGRQGFQRLVAEVSLGRVGAVLGLEVSRLARNNRDWYQLLDLCGLMNTLIVDAEGVYDPRVLNDRLLLGLKGTMSEAELGWIRQRAWEGALHKARRGELVIALPAGYVRTEEGRVEKHPDQRVRHAISLVFDKFAELGSAHQSVLWFRQQEIALPAHDHDPARGHRVRWRFPRFNAVVRILRNPVYAGAYAFGRTVKRTTVVDGVPRSVRAPRPSRDEWTTLIHDHHEAYISWDVYERNQHLIDHNATTKGERVRGAVRGGPSLLPGLLRCGHCGRKLHVRYGGQGGRVPRYECVSGHTNHGTERCISFGSWRVDQAMEQEILRVISPGAIEAALAEASTVMVEQADRRLALELEVQEACFEANRARRQYDRVEPENRLVATTLERRWDEALQRVSALEQRLEALQAPSPPHHVPDRASLLALADDLPRVWAAAAEGQTKKRIVRLLVEEVIAKAISDPPARIALVVHWKGGKHTQLEVARPRRGQHRRSADKATLDVVRDLARSLPDNEIARVLNRLGHRTGTGQSWTQGRVTSFRNYHEIAVYQPPAEGHELLTLGQAARTLGVNKPFVQRLIAVGLLPATQPILYAPWSIRPEDLRAEAVQQAVASAKCGRPLPRKDNPKQLSLDNSTI